MSRRRTIAVTLSREELMHRAQAFANYAARRMPRGSRVVVVATDVSGEWVGVGSNTNPKDIEAILRSALLGADRHDGQVIEVKGEEA